MSISLLGIGVVSALGCGIGSVKAGLEGSIQPLIQEHRIETADGEISLPCYTAGVIGLDRFVPRASLRRIDRFIQMSLLSSYLAVEDSGIDLKEKTRVGIVLGSGYGPLQTTFAFLDSLIDFGDKCASPTLFANSLHNAPASQASLSLKIQGPSLTLTCFERTTESVMSVARNWLHEGMADYVLAGVGDEYCDVRGYATVLSGSRDIAGLKPLDFDECTYLPGEGFVAFLLGRGPSEKGYGRIIDIKTGNHDAGIARDHEALFLAANGEQSTGRFYKPRTTEGNRFRAYSALYGSMPVGNGFDVAIAALSLKEGVIYPSPGEHTKAECLNGSERIGCLAYDRKGNHSLITLSR